MKKTILLTGATDGIGKLLAYKLAGDGHTLYLHGRNEKKLLDLVDDIKKQTGNSEIYHFIADFGDIDAVKTMSEKIRAEVPKIDVLVNNAGIYNSPVEKNTGGYDIRFVVNYLAPYVLTHELMEVFKKSEDPRVINLSSAAQSPVDIVALEGNRDLSASEAYAQSKLALTMWSFDFAKNNPDVTVIAVNPGSLLNTKMVQQAFGQHWSEAETGSNILYDMALGEEYKHHSGEYFDNDSGKFSQVHSDAYNPQKIDELLDTTQKLVTV